MLFGGTSVGSAAVLDRRVERSRLVSIDALNAATVGASRGRVDADASARSVDGVGDRDRDARHVVLLGAQQRAQSGVEELEGDGAGLLEDRAPVLGVGVVAEVGALVDEALPVAVDDDPERIALPGQPVGELAVALVVLRNTRPTGRCGRWPSRRLAPRRCAVRRRSSRRCCAACRAPWRAPSRRPGAGGAARRSASNPPAASTTESARHSTGPSRRWRAPRPTRPSSTTSAVAATGVPDPERRAIRGVIGDQPVAAVDVADVQAAQEQERPVGSVVGLALVHQPVAEPEPVQPANSRLGLA